MLHILKMYKHVVIFLIYEIINEIKEKNAEIMILLFKSLWFHSVG